MLTIDQIKNVSFSKARAGYDPEEVDEFINDVIEVIQVKDHEKNELIRKMDILAKKIEEYRENEDTVKNAFLTTQKMSDKIEKEANDKAEYIVKSAEDRAKEILAEAEKATDRAKQKYIAINNDSAKLKEDILNLYKKHLTIVNELPSSEDADKRIEEINKKYPSETKAVNKESNEISSSSKKDATQRNQVTIEDESTDSKFNQLQFGDNYDVE